MTDRRTSSETLGMADFVVCDGCGITKAEYKALHFVAERARIVCAGRGSREVGIERLRDALKDLDETEDCT